MKVLGLFFLSFVLLSALPFLWNEFQFVQFGFPFTFLQISSTGSPEYSQTVYKYDKFKLIYDLILIAIAVWAFSRLTTAKRTM